MDNAAFPASLTTLHLEKNHIRTITAVNFSDDVTTADNNNNLKYLYLSDNPLARIAPGAFKYLKQLRGLYLSGTALSRLPLTLSDLSQLSNLDLGGISQLTCTCREAASLVTWYDGINFLNVKGDCRGGTSTVKNFLANLAQKCPAAA